MKLNIVTWRVLYLFVLILNSEAMYSMQQIQTSKSFQKLHFHADKEQQYNITLIEYFLNHSAGLQNILVTKTEEGYENKIHTVCINPRAYQFIVECPEGQFKSLFNTNGSSIEFKLDKNKLSYRFMTKNNL